MSCAEALQTALKPLGLPVYPNKYTGPELEYIVTNYTTLGSAHGGDFAQAARYLVQVHYYLPDKQNPHETLEAICRALVDADFTCPEVIDVDDAAPSLNNAHGSHWLIECEFADGGYRYGECNA
jgi:hypothetical protein